MENLQRKYGEFLYTLQPAFLNINILHNHGAFVKINEITLLQYY